MTSYDLEPYGPTTALRPIGGDSPWDLLPRPGSVSPRQGQAKPRRKPLSSSPGPVRVGRTTLDIRASIMLVPSL